MDSFYISHRRFRKLLTIHISSSSNCRRRLSAAAADCRSDQKDGEQIQLSICGLKVRFHHHIFPTNLMTNSLTKLPHKQMSHIFVLFVSQKFVANHIGLLQTH
jgi:hypothetical protein